MNHEYRFFLEWRNESICTVLQVPLARASRLVLLLHGGPGGQKDGPSALYERIAQELADEGMASLRFDFLGSGQSSGRYRDMTLAQQVAQYNYVFGFAGSLGYTQIGAIGESYGATSLLSSIQSKPDRIALLWPCIDLLDNAFESFVTDEKLAVAREVGYIEEEGQEVGLPFLEELLRVRDVSNGLPRLSGRTLLIHGTADTEVPYSQTVRASDLLGDAATLVLVDGGDHCLAKKEERDIVYREVREFFASDEW